MKLLVSGSRNGRADVEPELDSFVQIYGKPELVIVGGARGVDSQAEAWAVARGLPVNVLTVEDVDWVDLGVVAGYARNEAMVQLCGPGDFCVAFPVGRSPGTYGCVNLAEKRGLTVYVLAAGAPRLIKPSMARIYLDLKGAP